jgi:hypothetical protein
MIQGCSGQAPEPMSPKKAHVEQLIHDLESRTWDF